MNAGPAEATYRPTKLLRPGLLDSSPWLPSCLVVAISQHLPSSLSTRFEAQGEGVGLASAVAACLLAAGLANSGRHPHASWPTGNIPTVTIAQPKASSHDRGHPIRHGILITALWPPPTPHTHLDPDQRDHGLQRHAKKMGPARTQEISNTYSVPTSKSSP